MSVASSTRLWLGATTALVLGACSRPPTPATPGPAPAAAAHALSWTTPLSSRDRAWIERTLERLSPRERVAQMVMLWVLGDYAHVEDSTFAEVRRAVSDDRIGGVIMSLGSPIEVASKVNSLQRLAHVPLLVASDLEPGLGRLVGGTFVPTLMSAGSATIFPSNMAIAATGDVRDALEVGRIIGREARAVGIHLAFAPTVDVNNNPSNPVINTRSFGEDPQRVAELAAAFVRGMQSEGVAATAKHFPGHGDTDTDSHLALPVVRSDATRLASVELVPFRASIDAGVVGVMTAHIALPAVGLESTPATLEPRIVTGLLRDSLGFRGLAVTDALRMQAVGQGYTPERAAVLAVQAGADILLSPTDVKRAIDAVTAAVAQGTIPASRIDESVRRILELKVRTRAARQPMVSLDSLRHVVGSPAHWNVARNIAERAVTLLRDSASLVPAPREGRFAVVTYAPELDVNAGRALAGELRSLAPQTLVARIDPSTSAAELDSLGARMRGADRIIVTTHVRTIEGAGRFAISPRVAAWIDTLATRERVVVVANGNPYVIAQFPRIGSYMVTYGIDASLERAAARALVGAAPIVGRVPISLPGFFAAGDGLRREAAP
ncbi:MAG TPA: glycoside hydrolase family 3 N-terminal domain-containing protein [Gemmatimonadaceae bacterium]|nr:glycoside hydrolase family 3 N-terminal domain-containing protein [Gemmatimonadaceae bacterium]